MKLAVVIVSYNVKYYLEQCLYSLRKALDGIEAQVYVVDNDSADDSVAYLASRFADVQVMESGGNVGFSRANNLAIRASHSEYVLLLNPDTLVGEGHPSGAGFHGCPSAGRCPGRKDAQHRWQRGQGVAPGYSVAYDGLL